MSGGSVVPLFFAFTKIDHLQLFIILSEYNKACIRKKVFLGRLFVKKEETIWKTLQQKIYAISCQFRSWGSKVLLAITQRSKDRDTDQNLTNKMNRSLNNFSFSKYDVKFQYKNAFFILRLMLLLKVVVTLKMIMLLLIFIFVTSIVLNQCPYFLIIKRLDN